MWAVARPTRASARARGRPGRPRRGDGLRPFLRREARGGRAPRSRALSPGAGARAAIPQPGSPDRWLLLADDGTNVSASFVDLGKRGLEGARAAGAEEIARTGFAGGLKALFEHLGGVYRSRDDLLTRVIPNANGPFAERALETGVAGVFGRFARFPAAREAPQQDGSVRVVLRDVRFGYLSPEVDPFTYVVRYDPAGRLLASGFPSGRWMRSERPSGRGGGRDDSDARPLRRATDRR